MSAFFIASVIVKNNEKFQQYADEAKKTFEAFGAEIMARGNKADCLVGESSEHAAAVVKFADLETLNEWYNSDIYQALVPLRSEAADMVITSYQVPAPK